MLKIRLARHGRKKAPFYRIVLTEHTKPCQNGYKTVLGRFNPLSHVVEAEIDEIKQWISKGAQPSERVAKLLYTNTKDEFFKKYFVEATRTKGKAAEEARKAEIEAKKQAEKVKIAAAKQAAEDAKKAEAEKEAEVVTQDVIEEKVEQSEDTVKEENKEEAKE